MSKDPQSIYPRLSEDETDKIYQDLSLTVQVYKLEKFEEHVINKAVVLIDAKVDMIDFSVKTIDDEIELLKEYNKEKKFTIFKEEMIEKVSEKQEFYTIIIQPYFFVQLKDRRDEFIESHKNKETSDNKLESPEEETHD